MKTKGGNMREMEREGAVILYREIEGGMGEIGEKMGGRKGVGKKGLIVFLKVN